MKECLNLWNTIKIVILDVGVKTQYLYKFQGNIWNNDITGIIRSTGTASDPREVVVALIAIYFQISVVAFQKLLCMAAAPGRGIAIQDDCRKPVLTGAEQPHEWPGFGSALFLIQHLDSCFICHCKLTFQQFQVKVIIHLLVFAGNSFANSRWPSWRE